ncbi:crotonobetainyl-CoA:carnitine CoA-transferase CaiB-like acyl-CoA transferase [Saccharopolyspora lacisalsi]|uniref:Crotonobetainyl-CoA:carnitine CoA-transferase CaiB-like acyl-CoA transferase n=1 Tax=Halosaccharopolyspora lacisalsi TaxID=1000566 RepID=A0A839DVF1_9PSEU|nr:CoA transferase [Halosaccharopolyspora lacisalsi]MBA8825952.1 crotonobetainyl-CoA:carnitine CoA-transferase CaiB-like acyl-CoA transferase [Halosaccharopolyspora lacisalsi]
MSDPSETVTPNTAKAGNGPLAGVRVIDMATVVMGPYAAQILGDLGADVIRIESPRDSARNGSTHRTPGMTSLHLNVNRNKRSVDLNLKDETEHARALELIDTADVLITNMRVGALQRLHMDHESLAERNPKLVYTHAQGFRADSDRAQLAAYDETVQAASGMIDMARRAGDIGVPAVLPSIFADKITAQTIAYSTMAALLHQRTSGQGQLVEVPMADTLLAFNMVEHLQGQSFEPPMGPTGFPNSFNEGHRARPTKDGLAMIIPYTPQNFRDLFAAAERPDLAEDPRINAETIDARNDGEDLARLIESVTPQLTTDEWIEVCTKHSIPVAPVLKLEEAVDDPYVREGHLLDVADHPSEGAYRAIGVPMEFSATPASIRKHAPVPGQDTTQVLSELDSETGGDR